MRLYHKHMIYLYRCYAMATINYFGLVLLFFLSLKSNITPEGLL
jgi:hypothetical protein